MMAWLVGFPLLVAITLWWCGAGSRKRPGFRGTSRGTTASGTRFSVSCPRGHAHSTPGAAAECARRTAARYGRP
jgi:hypothetical protein